MRATGLKPPKNTDFSNVGFYALSLVLLTLLGFWPSYFSKFIEGTADFTFYFHFHALMASSWIALLIVQPLLIRKKKLSLHKKIGKLSYLVLPLFFMSVILLKHHTIRGVVTEGLGASMWLQTKDLVIIGIMFIIAMTNKSNVQIHARAMIATGIVFIEPTLGRFIINTLFPQFAGVITFGIAVGLLYILIISLIFIERKQRSGRWVFPLLLLLFMVFHYLLFFRVSFPFWDALIAWFVHLPLT